MRRCLQQRPTLRASRSRHLQVLALLWVGLCELSDALLDTLNDLVLTEFESRLLVRACRTLHELMAAVWRDERVL